MENCILKKVLKKKMEQLKRLLKGSVEIIVFLTFLGEFAVPAGKG